ncbi:hypothetical protein AB1N83_008354 [Pleurotus pulmonarius]
MTPSIHLAALAMYELVRVSGPKRVRACTTSARSPLRARERQCRIREQLKSPPTPNVLHRGVDISTPQQRINAQRPYTKLKVDNNLQRIHLIRQFHSGTAYDSQTLLITPNPMSTVNNDVCVVASPAPRSSRPCSELAPT